MVLSPERALALPQFSDGGDGDRRRPGGLWWISLGWIAVVALLAALADVLPLADPNHTGAGRPGEGPGLHHWLGTDQLGRDLLSRVVFGSRVSLSVGVLAIVGGLLVGGTLGLLAGYLRGRIETAIMGLVDVLLAFPSLVFALAIVTFVGRSVVDITVTIGVLAIAPLARVTRASTINCAKREYVTAARALGATRTRILWREVLPNVVPGAVSYAVIGVGLAMVAEGSLSFLGLSVNPQHPTWGGLISQGYTVLNRHPWVSILPAVVLFLTILALNFAGDRLRAVFDVGEAKL
jgi:peptide/nickel transport system permease protein